MRKPEKVTARTKDPLADEERGDLAFATQCAHHILKWMNLTKAQAEKFVDDQGPYYLPGEEVVEIPAVVPDVPDSVFPPLSV